jgi:hypothetical protein
MTSISQMGSANNSIPNFQQLASISKATSNEMKGKHTTQTGKVDGKSFQANGKRGVNEADDDGLADEVNGIGVQEGRKRKRSESLVFRLFALSWLMLSIQFSKCRRS